MYREAGTFEGEVKLSAMNGERTSLVAPSVRQPATVHVILQITDHGTPALTAYRRVVVTLRP